MAFFSQTLPIFMRQQGASLETIGAFGLLGLPWMLKFLWSPFIDRFSLNRVGKASPLENRHYGTWILFFQILLAGCVAISGLLDVRQNLPILMGFVLLACFCSASQDIATDALAVRMLVGSERAWGSTIQTAGNYLGSFIGAGGVLILLDRIGWRSSLLTIAGVVLLAGIPLLRHKEHKIVTVDVKPSWRSIISFCRRDRMIFWMVFVVLYSLGSNMTGAMMRTLLVDLKFSLTDIGQINGLVGCSAGIIGSLIGGAIVSKLGVQRSLFWFGIFQGVAVLACLPLVRGNVNLTLAYATNFSLLFFGSMCDMAIATVMLEKSELATAGTDYTIQTSLIYLSVILSMLLAGSLSEHLGYEGMLFVAFGLCLLSIILVKKWRVGGKTHNSDRLYLMGGK